MVGIVEGLASLVAEQIPIIVMVDEDMAKALGHALSAHLPKTIRLSVLIRSK